MSMSGFTQTITPIFPANGSTVSFSQLGTEGFQWSSSMGNVPMTLFISSTSFPPNLPTLKVEDVVSPYPITFNQSVQVYLKTGTVTWWVREPNSGIESARLNFNIADSTLDLKPSPTPQVQPTPSGDIDTSLRIDAGDLLLLATHWGRETNSFSSGMDLNQDSKISQDDVIAYIKRYGQPAPEPTPTPPVGQPFNIRFEPGERVSFADSPDFTIRWNKPTYPEGTDFVYDLMVEYPSHVNVNDIVEEGLTETSFQPFPNGLTLEGDFNVYLRARIPQTGNSTIATSKFSVVLSTPPTPTPVPSNADLSQDQVINEHDVAMFDLAFGSEDGDDNFNPSADYHTDGVIDAHDLILFFAFYNNRTDTLPKPLWLSADVPTMESQGFGGCTETSRETIFFTSVDSRVINYENPCAIAELNDTNLTFSAITDAVDYEVKIQSATTPSMFIQNRTDGAITIPIRWTLSLFQEELNVTVRAVFRDGRLGENSDPLVLTLP